MRRVPVAILVLLLAPALWALDDTRDQKKSDKPPPEKPKTPADQYRELVKDFQQEQQDYFQAYAKAKTPEERQKLQSPNKKFGERMLELAEKNPKDPVAVDALTWVMQWVRSGPEADKALDVLLREHMDSKQLGNLCQSLRYSGSPKTEPSLRAILEKSPHHNVQGQACIALGQYLKDQAQSSRSPGPEMEKQSKEAESLFERVAKEYADIKYGEGTLGAMAKGELFEMRFLVIGKEAPDIEGEDIDAKKFKLSDYRGKVVLLDFWGNW